MSIFDVIKYPISNPPTEEELKAIPKEIFNKWRDKEFMSFYTLQNVVSYLYSIRNSQYEDHNSCSGKVRRLKGLLEEYNEPI